MARKYFYNEDYRGKVEVCADGKLKFLISPQQHDSWVEVSEDVYCLLAADPERVRKSNRRFHQRTYSTDQEYFNTEGTSTALEMLEAHYPQMASVSAEDAFYIEGIHAAVYAYTEKMGNEWADLYSALFVAEIPASEYAKQLGVPASTIRSRKARLAKEIKKFF